MGLLISEFKKPVYESSSAITTVIDFAYSGKLKIDEEDHLILAVGDVIQSDEVMNSVITEALNAGLVSSAEEIRSSLSASRQGFRWELSSRFVDPNTAREVNQIWLDESVHELEKFRQNSLIALAEFNAQAGVENCFQQAVVVDPVSAYCSPSEFQAVREQISALESGSLEKSLLSRLLASRISFEVTSEPEQPSEPVHLGRNISTIAGVVLGLLVAIALIMIGFPAHRKMDKEN